LETPRKEIKGVPGSGDVSSPRSSSREEEYDEVGKNDIGNYNPKDR
jgi:hypothetical protein